MKKYLQRKLFQVLAAYARKVINIHKPFIIAITGSVGKSSTKEAVFKVLSENLADEVRANYGSMNAEIGIPLTILGYESVPHRLFWPIFLIAAWFRINTKKYPKILILEIGIEHPGDMKDFMSIARPDIVIITSVAGAHLESFSGIAEYREEKIQILNYLKTGGKVLLNIDDINLAAIQDKNSQSVSISTGSRLI